MPKNRAIQVYILSSVSSGGSPCLPPADLQRRPRSFTHPDPFRNSLNIFKRVVLPGTVSTYNPTLSLRLHHEAHILSAKILRSRPLDNLPSSKKVCSFFRAKLRVSRATTSRSVYIPSQPTGGQQSIASKDSSPHNEVRHSAHSLRQIKSDRRSSFPCS